MIIRTHICKSILCLAALSAASLGAQQKEPPATLPPNRNLIFLDPAHGGTDSGAHLKGNLLEKDINLALATRLKADLLAHGFQVISSRDGDTGPTSDQRAELANHAHPFACILIHASASGFGPYLAASSLPPDNESHTVLPWDTAQAAFLSDSMALLTLASKAFAEGRQPAITLRSSVPPIDSLTCPAILLELAPISSAPLTDSDYQQRIADALTAAVVALKAQSDTTIPAPPATATPKKPGDPTAAPKPAPKPKLLKPAAPMAPASPGTSSPGVSSPEVPTPRSAAPGVPQ